MLRFRIAVIGLATLSQCSDGVRFVTDAKGHATSNVTSNLATRRSKCSKCPQDVSIEKTWGLEWVIFPPSIFPNPITTFICTPVPESDEWNGAVSVNGCDSKEMEEDMSEEDRKACAETGSKLKEFTGKAGKMSNTIKVWFQQMLRCGGCALCDVWHRIKKMMRGLQAGIKKAVHSMSAFAKAKAPDDVILQAASRFDTMLLGAHKHSSLLEGEGSWEPGTSQAKHEHEASHASIVQQVEDELRRHWSTLSSAHRKQHVSLLEKAMNTSEVEVDAMLEVEIEKLHQKISDRATSMTAKMPGLFETEECKKALSVAQVAKTLEIAINIEHPNVVSAMLHLFPVPSIGGVLQALIPEILVMAIPKENKLLKQNMMADCLHMLNGEQERYLNSCREETPLLTCTARVSQMMMSKLVFQEWWPLPGNDANTRKKRRKAMKALSHATAKSCLENKIQNDKGKNFSVLLDRTKEGHQAERFENIHCPYIRGVVDGADGTEREVPGFTDQVWLASLLGHAQSVKESPETPRQCPQIIGFATAYCAQEFKCGANSTDDKTTAMVQAEKDKADVDKDGIISDAEAQTMWQKLIKEFSSSATWAKGSTGSTGANARATREQLDDEWTRLWVVVNALFPGRWTWPDISSALNAESASANPVSFKTANFNWGFIYNFLVRRRAELTLMQKAAATPIATRRRRRKAPSMALDKVLTNLETAYHSTICYAGGLTNLDATKLQHLGVPAKDAATQVAALEKGVKVRENAGEDGWYRLRIKVHKSASWFGKDIRLKKFISKIKEAKLKCKCMCMQTSGRLSFGKKSVASKMPHCAELDPPVPDSPVGLLTAGLQVEKAYLFVANRSKWVKLKGTELRLHPDPTGGPHSCKSILSWLPWKQKPDEVPEEDVQYRTGAAYIADCKPRKELTSFWVKSLTSPGKDLELILYKPWANRAQGGALAW